MRRKRTVSLRKEAGYAPEENCELAEASR
jgi:hypothetical protein